MNVLLRLASCLPYDYRDSAGQMNNWGMWFGQSADPH